jgi:DNA modification methylase
MHGDCRELIATLDDESVASIVTDPPYELGFMGKKWDNSGIAYDVQLWTECLRVLKPGGHLLAFGGTRTYHRMACAIEDAGFEIRDSIHWLYGSGFPKSHDVSKAIDKANGRQFEDRYALGRHIKSSRLSHGFTQLEVNAWFGYRDGCQHWERQDASGARVPTLTDYSVLKERLGLSDEFDELVQRIAAERQVVGTATLTTLEVAPGEGRERPQVVLDITAPATDGAREWQGWGTALKPAHEPIVMARKPLVGTVAANVLQHGTGALNIDSARVGRVDGDVSIAGKRTATFGTQETQSGGDGSGGWKQNDEGRWPANLITDGSIEAEWVRYFYSAKPSKRERNAGLNAANTHPTVKPLALMRYLVRLVTPPGGTVLEPFAGSGTTLAAAILEGFDAIGCELTADYLPIIEGRIAWAQQERAKANDSLFGENE